MNTLTSIIIDFAIKNNEQYIEMRQRVARKAAEVNQDVEPTVAIDGRLHAPFDGYLWDDRKYHGGSYLPLTLEMWEYIYESAADEGKIIKRYDATVHNSKLRFKSTLQYFKELKTSLEELAEKNIKIKADISHGQVWGDEDNCYIYIITRHEALVNALDTYIQETVREQEIERQKRFDEIKAQKGVAPTGKQSIVGKIISIKEEHTHYSYHGEVSTKVMIELENKSTVYGTLPDAIDNAKVGDAVQFTATFNHADNDNTHSFYKRPSKAKLLELINE